MPLKKETLNSKTIQLVTEKVFHLWSKIFLSQYLKGKKLELLEELEQENPHWQIASSELCSQLKEKS